MNKKKVLALSMSAAMAASAFAGIPVMAAEEPMTISVMGIDWGVGPVSDSEMEQYWEEMLGVNLDIEWVGYQDYDQKLNTMIAAGSTPDVIQINKVNGSYYYPIFTQAIDAGQFVDMSEYLFGENGIASTNAVMKNWDESLWEQAKYNDGVYILPRSKAESGQNSGIEVRRDLMKKYGFEEEPKTMDELKTWLIDLSKAATEGEGHKVYALDFFDNAGNGFMDDRIKAFAIAFTGQTDWEVNEETGEFEYMQFDKNYINFLNWVKDLYDAGAIDPEFALGNADTSKWKAGNSVAYLCQWYNWNQSADLVSTKIFDKNCPDTYEAWCLMPVEGPEAYTVSPNYTDIDSCIAISASCSEEKIAKIMEAFNGTEETYPGYDEVMKYGVEDVHYTLLEDGTKDTSSNEEFKKRNTEGYVGAWNQIFLKTDQNQVKDKFMRDGAKRASDESIARVEEIKDFVYTNLEETGMKNAIQNLQSETYNNQWSILTDDVNTMATQYVMGQIDEATWTSFVQGIVDSADYKAIQAEFKEAAGL
jgi:putative aldouronate transport system substrate-binding protein